MSYLFYQITLAAAGFSIISLILLGLQERTESRSAAIFANALLFILTCIQLLQVFYSSGYLEINNAVAFIYILFLGMVGPVFYLYSQYVLYSFKIGSIRESVHLIPAASLAITGYFFTEKFALIYSLVFMIGGVYMARLAWSLFQLRERRSLFKMEFAFTAVFLSWAVAVVFVGVISVQAHELLIPAQVIMLTVAIAGAIHIQLNYPQLLSSLEEMVSQQYKTSTLTNIDCEGVKQRLAALISDKKVYSDSELSLSSLADMLSLKSHQLSELINTQLGMSFSAYLRAQRVKAAEEMLKTEADTSVLAISMAVGFSSQSAFYVAFKEVHSMAPGQYRRQQAKKILTD